LNEIIFICVVALASGICILGVTVIIFILIMRRSKRRSAQIYQEKQEENLDAAEPQELLLYKTSVQEPNGQCVS
jgi:flagellar biosynthesis/type III secretory pathway M-ring protein FliF/YscJ